MATPPDNSTLTQLVVAQAAVRDRMDMQAQQTAIKAVRSFTGWYSTGSITDWAADLVKKLKPLHRAMATNADAYLARSASLVAGKTIKPVGAVDVSNLRALITPEGAYARAADAFRYQQSRLDHIASDLNNGVDLLEPPDLQDPIDAAVARILEVADLDAQLVQRDQSQSFYEKRSDTITGWRRIIHPELSKGGSCGLCVVISDRLYGPTEPLEVHAECKCTTLAVVRHIDPGLSLNAEDLKTLYADAGGTRADLLKRTRYRVDEHGELGRVLTDSSDNFRTARQAKADESKSSKAKSPEEQRATLQKVFDSQSSALPKARELAAADPKKWGSYLTILEARVKDLSSQLAA